MTNLFKILKNKYIIYKAGKELDSAAKAADKMFRMHNKRFYVIPDIHHNLRVFSWSQLKQMRKQGLFSNRCKEVDFIMESFYYTPSRLEQTSLSAEKKAKKRKAWLEYYKAYRM